MSNTDRFTRLLKSGSAKPLIVGAAVGAGVGLLTAAPVLLATAVGGALGALIAARKK